MEKLYIIVQREKSIMIFNAVIRKMLFIDANLETLDQKNLFHMVEGTHLPRGER